MMTILKISEISSDEEEEDDEEEPDDDPTTPPARGSRKERTSEETEAGNDDIEVDEEEEDMGGQPSEAKKRRTEVRNIREQFDRMIKEASQVKFCFVCGGEHGIEECPQQDDDHMKNALSRMRSIMEEQSKSQSSSEKSKAAAATMGRKDKLPKRGIMPQGKRWTRTRFTEKEEVTKSFYSQPAFMYEIGDREEGGPWLLNGIEVHPPGQGVRDRAELDALVERAAEESPPVLPSIRELNAVIPKDNDAFQKWLKQEKEQHGDNWNFRYLQPFTFGIDIGTLYMARISGEEYVGTGWCNVDHYAENTWMGRKRDSLQWMTDMSKRFNAALRHSVGCVQDKRGFQGLPCDEAGWVNVEQILKYDHIWKDGHTLAGTQSADFDIIVERWNNFQKIIFAEYKQTKRTRAQVLGLKVTKGELERVLYTHSAFTRRISREALRIEISNADREIWLWPVAVRAPMAHSKNKGGVRIEDSKTSYQMNPSVGYTLGGGFHCTTFECIAQIFREGLRPGGGGDRINTFFVPFAPWDERSNSVLRFKRIDGADIVYIYMTYESLSKFAPRVSADGHILVQQTIPFNSFDAVWHFDRTDQNYYRLMITKGYGVRATCTLCARCKEIATVDRFDHLIENVASDESSPDWKEIRELVSIKMNHTSYTQRLFPGHPTWNEAISLLALTHRPNKEGHRLCPACLSETPAMQAICTNCKGYLISHGLKRRIKVTVASFAEPERRPQDDDVKDHVKQAWEKIKIDLTDDDDEVQAQDDDFEMGEQHDDAYYEEGEEEEEFEADDLNAEKRDFREQDEVDKFLNREREEAEMVEDEEETTGGSINIQKFKAGEVQDVVEYPAWMARVDFGSRVLPTDPCMIGDAQPDLIKILLLQMGVNSSTCASSSIEFFVGQSSRHGSTFN